MGAARTGTDVPAAGSAWPAPTAAGPVDATVSVPGSKSLTNRYLVLSALAQEPSRLRAPLHSRDTGLMAKALQALGTIVEEVPGAGTFGPDWIVTPRPLHGPATVDTGLAGTVMRFVPPVAALADGPVRFDGDPAARRRPMATVVSALRELGVAVDDDSPDQAGRLPFTVHGRGAVRGGRLRIDASASSQFVSGLLLVGARFDEGLVVEHVGPPIPSTPHVVMTVEALRDVGVVVDDADPSVWRVDPGSVGALDVQVEPDLSNAAPFVAAAAVTGGRVRVPGWPQYTTQAGDLLRDLLDQMGADVTLDRDGLTVEGTGELYGIDADLADAGELTPTVAALAALADGPSVLRGIAHLRGHETDRLQALDEVLTAVGARVEQLPDGLVITPGPHRAARLDSYADHRMVHAAAVLGLAVEGVEVRDPGAVSKTLPDFVARWDGMLATPAGARP
jgi:3-phosphoshikimate 1-carboxyvinyltransferase